MQRTNGDSPKEAGEGHSCPFAGLWRMFRRGYEFFRICLRANVLLRPFRRRAAMESEPADVTFPKLMEQLKSARPANPCVAAGLVAWATAAVVVSISGWYVLAPRADTSDRVISTGAHETKFEQLPDRVVLSLEADTTVRVNVAGRERIAKVEKGTAMFVVPRGLATPFLIDTFLARAVVQAEARLSVAVDGFSVVVNVEEGIILLYDRRAGPGAQARRMQKGDSVLLRPDVMVFIEVARDASRRS